MSKGLPENTCPHIARLEMWLQPKLTKEEFQELEGRMDTIRQINLDLRILAKEKHKKLRRMKRLLMFGGLLFLLSSFVYLNVCKTYKAHVEYVYDGDTITVDAELGFTISKEEKLRLARIDAPELRGDERPLGLISRDALRELIDDKDITFTDEGTGKYGRTIAEVFVDDTINVSDWLVRNGYAEYKNYN